MRGDRLAGIITDIDLMRTMLDLLGARQPGIRLTLKIPEAPGGLSKITAAIAAQGGDISALGTLPSDEPLKWWVMVKARFVDEECLMSAIRQVADAELLDVRTE